MNKKAQGLPMETIIIIVLVVIVLAAVGIMFFTNFTKGQSGITQGSDVAGEGIEDFIGTSGSISVCGNSKVEGSEQCDDGNTASLDGCSSTCQTE